MKTPLFEYTVIPDLKTCEWKTNRVRNHKWQKAWTCMVIEFPGRKPVLLCQYCYLIWWADSFEALQRKGFSVQEIRAIFPSGPSNESQLKEIERNKRELELN